MALLNTSFALPFCFATPLSLTIFFFLPNNERFYSKPLVWSLIIRWMSHIEEGEREMQAITTSKKDRCTKRTCSNHACFATSQLCCYMDQVFNNNCIWSWVYGCKIIYLNLYQIFKENLTNCQATYWFCRGQRGLWVAFLGTIIQLFHFIPGIEWVSQYSNLGLQFWVLQLQNSSQHTEIHTVNFSLFHYKILVKFGNLYKSLHSWAQQRGFWLKSAELEVPLNLLLLIITAPCQAMHIRASAASSALSLAMTIILAYQQFSWLAKVATPSQEVISLTSAGILMLFIISLILIFRSL